MADSVHMQLRGIVIPDTPGVHGHFETVCGLRLDEGLGITDNKDDVTCPKCQKILAGKLETSTSPKLTRKR